MTLKKKIQMVDLKSQYNRLSEEIDHAIHTCIQSTQFIQGPEVKIFEQNLSNYLQSKHTISCGNGTDALMLACMALELKQGDQVIVPAFTYIASVEILKILGLEPIFCDVNPQHFMMTSEYLESAYTPECKAIIVVHLYGQCADMEDIKSWAEQKGLYIIEDNAQSIGAKCLINNQWQFAGTIGHIGTTSFFPSKNLGAFGDGGAIFTQDDTLSQNLRMMANHGQSKKYIHDTIGVNSRLDTLQAAILNVKLKYLDDFIEKRNQAANLYDQHLNSHPKISIPYRLKNSTHVFHQYTILLENEKMRDGLKNHLQSKEIPSMIYYPLPIYLQKPYLQNIDLPNTSSLCNRVLSLPIHTEKTEEEISYICKNIIQYLDEYT